MSFLKALPDVPSDVFARELRRYLVCMICGTSIRTADIILEKSDLVLLSTPMGKLLALIRADVRSGTEKPQLVLLFGSEFIVQGFLLATRVGDSGFSIVGRTIIPNSAVLDSLTAICPSAS